MSNRFFPIAALFLVAASGLFAQQDRGTFVGTVTDPTGAAVPAAKVTVTGQETNATYETVTNESGQYRVPNLPIGVYRIQFETQGFKTVIRENIRLSVTSVTRVDAVLEVGATTESITVTGEIPLLQTDSPEVGTLMENRRVIDMPLGFSGGRYAENFAYRLTPGVQGNNWESRINGSPAFAKEILLDGGSATVYIGGHMGESSVSMEAIEEFKVQTSGMSAEFGRTAGGVFNFVMKSGTNQYRGTAMGQIHNEWMDANTFANNYFGRPRQRDRRHNYAFSGGGPVRIPKVYNGRDKSFFYASYEKYKESFAGGGSPTVTVPIPEWWDGNLSRYLTSEILGQDALGRNVMRGAIYDPATNQTVGGQLVRNMFPGNIIPASRLSQVSRNLASVYQQHYQPQIRDESGQFALINNAFFPIANQAGFHQHQLSIKGDHYINNNHKVSGSYAWIDRPRTLLDQGGVWDFNDPNGGPLSRARLQHVETFMARFAYDWTVTPTILNHFVASWNRQRNPSLSKHLGEPGGQILGIQGIRQDSNFPEMNFGSSDRINFPTVGYQSNDLLVGNAWQFSNTASMLRGRHSMKFGIDWRTNGLNARNNAGPASFNFGRDVTGLPGFVQTGHSFASMLLGQVNSANIYIDTPVGSQFRMLSLFFQDDWRVSNRLTLNLGARWDYQPQQTEKYDRIHNFNALLVDPRTTGLLGAVEYAGTGEGRTGSRNFYPNSMRHFSPRIGLAYQISQKLVFRAGYGIFFNGRIPNDWSGVPYGQKYGWQAQNVVNQPLANLPAFNWDNGYPGVVQPPGVLNPSIAQSLWGTVAWDPAGGRVGYTQQWNANFQYELPAGLVVDLGYIGTKSTGVLANQLRQINQMHPRTLALGDLLGQWIDRESDIPAAARAMGAVYPFATPGTWMPVKQTLQPFPQIPDWSTVLSNNSPLGFTTYHSMQLQVNKRFSHGLQFLANYNWSKSIDNIDSAFGSWSNYGRPLDYYNLGLEKTVSAADRTHIVKIGAMYDLPYGRGRQWGQNINPVLEFLAGGWTLQYIGNYMSGLPLGFGGTGVPNFNNAGVQRALIVNPDGSSLRNSSFDPGAFQMNNISAPNYAAHRYINTSLVRDPARYTFGNASYRMSQIRDFAFYNDDFSLQKNFPFLSERGGRIQFRAEFLNLFNRHRFAGINTNPANPLFGQITSVSNDRRQIQFGVRADF